MEDRKRSAGDDLAPPSKRQQAMNGKASANDDLPWSGEIEVCLRRHNLTANDPFLQSVFSYFDLQCLLGLGFVHYMYPTVYDLSI